MRFIQLSDLHLRTDHLLYGLDPWKRLNSVLEEIVRCESPDFVVITGDLVDCGLDDAEAYARLRRMLEEAGLLFFVTAGNHDVTLPPAFAVHGSEPAATLRPGVYSGPLLETDEALCLFTNTALAQSGAGEMPAESLELIESSASRAVWEHKALLIFGHHPPFAAGYGVMDAAGLRNASELFAALKKGRQSAVRDPKASLPLAAYFCGHLHRPISAATEELLCWCAPSIAHPLAPYCRADSIAGTDADPGYLRAVVGPWSSACEFVFVNNASRVFPIPYIPFEKETESSSEGPLKVAHPKLIFKDFQ